MKGNWINLLKNTKALDLVISNQKVIGLNSNEPLKNAFKLLKKNHILSLPIFEENNQKVLGFLDVLDICSYALYIYRSNTIQYWTSNNFMDEIVNKEFFEKPVKDLINFSGRNEFILLDKDSSILDILQVFQNKKSKCHRVAIKHDNNQINIVSHMDLLQFTYHHINDVPFSNSPIKDLGLLHSCIMMRYDVKLIEAIEILCENGISGIALVDWENKLLANFSATDLIGMIPEAFHNFHISCLDWLRQFTTVKSKIPPKTIPEKTNFAHIIKIFVNEEVHRLFIIDKDNHPLEVISTSDIIPILQIERNTIECQ